MHKGLVISKWNRWVAAEGNSVLCEVEVGRLECHADGYQYQTNPDVAELEKTLQRREKLLASLSAAKAGNDRDSPLRSKAHQWMGLAEDYQGELYALQLDFDSINKRYFDGQSGLFPISAHALSQLVEQAEKLAILYNRDLAADLEQLDSGVNESDSKGSETRHAIDLSDLRGRIHGSTVDQATYTNSG